MDVMPPQAPPAAVSSSQQEVIDALGRLVAVQTWLAGQQEGMPDLPAHLTASSRETWLASLDAFWRQPVPEAPGDASVARIDALAKRLGSVMRDDAIVRRLDGTLGVAAADLAERFVRMSVAEVPPGFVVRSLRVGDADYAGAVIVYERDDPAIVLRFLPDRGWDAFTSLQDLHSQTEAAWRQRLARRRELPGVRIDDIERVVADEHFVDSSSLQGDVFGTMARRIVSLQREKSDDAWPATDEADASAWSNDHLLAALDLHDTLDIAALLVARENRLTVSVEEQRLARVPADAAHDWRDAEKGYRSALLLAASWAHDDAEGAPLTLARWCRKELLSALSRRGIVLDPDDIRLEIRGNEGFALPATGATSSPAVQMSLAEFALHNVGYYDGRRVRVVTEGLPAGAQAPGMHALRELSRELDLAPRFASYLRARVADPQGRRFRTTTMNLQQARMRIEATAARMAAYLPQEAAVFLDDHGERGYRMVEAVLDSPAAATRASVDGHRIAVRQLVYRGAAVSDVLLIGVRDARSSPRVVLYTPDAPDGRAFREFSDRATLARQFLYAPTFQAYLLRRLPAEFGETLANGSRRFRVTEATRRANWVLTAPGEGRGTVTEEAFEERVVDGDIRTALFDAEIVRQVRDVEWVGRSTSEADTETVMTLVGDVLGALRGPGSLVEDTLGAVGQALRATWRFYDNVRSGDVTAAFVDFTGAYTATLGVIGWRSGASHAARQALSVRGNTTSRPLNGPNLRVPDTRRRLDPRYASRNVDLHDTRPDALGVHRLNGRRYIRQHELVFEIRRTGSSDTWRLVRPEALDAAFPGPGVQPSQAGGWRLRTDVGLPGGGVDAALFAQPRSRAVTGEDLLGLSEFQQWTFQQSFMQRLRDGGEASLIYWEATTQVRPRFVTLRQRTAWNDALRTARATPREPIPGGTQPGPTATWRILPPDQWPNQLWHYPQGTGATVPDHGPMVLSLEALPGSGLIGVPLTTQPPSVPGRTWIQLRLDRYRGRPDRSGSIPFRIVEDLRGPQPRYILQSSELSSTGVIGLEPGDFSASGQTGATP